MKSQIVGRSSASTTKVVVKSIGRVAESTPSPPLPLCLNRAIANYMIFVFHSIRLLNTVR